MNIDKKLSQEGAHETAAAIDLFKSKNTGELTYKTQYGKTVTMADKDYVNETVSTAVAEAVSEPLSSIHFGVDPKTIGPKVIFTRNDYGNEIDRIIPGEIEITRGNEGGGIFNIAYEDSYQIDSPNSTYWNSNFVDSKYYGWAKSGTLYLRNFDTWTLALDEHVGVNIIGKELVMVAQGTEQTLFFIVKFTKWTEGGKGGGFSYERYQIFPQIVFDRPSDSPEIVDVISDGLIIKRDNIRGLYNAVLENKYDNNNYTSPKGTRWSSTWTDDVLGGSNDYSNVRERVYGTWREAVNNNPPDNVGIDLIMHDLSTDLYWLIVVNTWGIGDNGDLGSVNYTRKLIPLAEGIKFADGVYMTELPATGGSTVDANGNVIIADSSNNTVKVTGEGFTQHIENFSGMLIVNDHYDGRVETWIAGGGPTVLLGATTGELDCNSTLEIEGNGYKWTNVDNLKGPLTFTIIKTRANS